MLLTQIDIKYFRGIEELSLPLDNLFVLIGDNNVGKSTILDALRLCLTRSLTRRGTVFEEYDYHLESSKAEPSTSQPIEITLTFAESQEAEWPDEISQLLPDAEQVDEMDLRSVTLRVKSYWTAPGLLDTRVRVFDLMRPPQLERVFPALPGPAFGSRSPRESNDGYTGS